MSVSRPCVNHKPIQHRDGKPPWCKECGLTADYRIPPSRFDRKGVQMDYMDRAKTLVVDYYNARVEKTDKKKLTLEDVYVVWFSKTLQNWKVLISTTVSDGMYYELTHNGDKSETYIDVYKKWDNVAVPDDTPEIVGAWSP